MKNVSMIISSLIFLLLSVTFVYATDFEKPNIIDFGNCNIGNDTLVAVYMKPFYLVNKFESDIFIQDIDIVYDYPNSITKNGNYFGLFGQIFNYAMQEEIIKPQDTAFFTIWFFSKYVDEISKNSSLSIKLIYKYRIGDDFTSYLDTTIIKAKAVNDSVVFTVGDNYFEFNKCSSELNEKDQTSFSIDIFNNTISDISIDSINIIKQNPSFNIIGFTNFNLPSDQNIKNVPITIKADSVMRLWVKYTFGNYETAGINIKFFGHYLSTSLPIILEDSVIINTRKYPDVKIYYIGSMIYTEYGQTVIGGRLSIKGCSIENTYLDSVSYSSEWNKDELVFEPDVPFPYYFNSDSVYQIGKPKFIGKISGFKQGYMILNFRQSNGIEFKRYFGQQTFVEEPLGVPEDNNKFNEEFIIYPNPAKDNINIKTEFKLPGTIKIVSVLGEKLLEKAIFDKETSISLKDQFQNGIFFIIFENNDSKHFYKFIINK